MKKYEFTRSIRFYLNGNMDGLYEKNLQDEKDLYQSFIKSYQKLLNDFENAVFYDKEKVKLKLEVGYKWIRNYARDEYNELNIDKNSPKKYTINEAKFLSKVYENWLENNEKLFKELKDVCSRERENKSKRSDIAFAIKTFASHDYFSFVKDFVLYAKDKSNSRNLNILGETVGIIEKFAEKIQNHLAPDQSSGIEVARASFNFYAINKISKNFDEDLKNKKKKLTKNFQGEINNSLLRSIGFEKFLESAKEENEYIYGAEKTDKLSIDNLYNALKDFKAGQKSEFLEKIRKEPWRQYARDKNENQQKTRNKIKNIDIDKLQRKTFSGFDDLGSALGIEKKETPKFSHIDEEKNAELCLEWIKEKISLFESKNKDDLKLFLKITKEIEELGIEKNQAKQLNNYRKEKGLDKEIRDKKIKRGAYFQGGFVFKKYFDYCDIYKKVAMERGKIFAEIRSLKQEEIEARLLKYWSFIVEKNRQRKLLLIPKNGDNLQKAKKYINSLGKNTENNSIIYSLNSLTLRVLEKLMRRNGGKDIEKFNESEENKIYFYKKILSGLYPKIKLDFAGYENEIREIAAKNHKTIEGFRMDLEKIAYVLGKISISEKELESFQDEFNAKLFDISSYDLERNITKEKEHTKFWNEFWGEENQKNNFPVRINPEVRIFYRNKQKDLPKEKQGNRFSKEKIMVAFTITQNAAQEKMEVAFQDKDQLIGITKQFNKDVIKPFVEEKAENLYYYGIDRGQQELASLCITRFSQEKYEAMLSGGEVKKNKKPKFPSILSYKIKDDCINNSKELVIDKDGNKKEGGITLINNPSYFIDDDVFEEVNTPFFDLTTAKLIKGKIILNGDVKTYLSLKEANVKRKLFDIFNKIDFEKNIEYCGGKEHSAWNIKNKEAYFMRNAFVISLRQGERGKYQILCYYQEKMFKYRNLQKMQKILQDYLDDLRGDKKMETITIDKINNLRDAITGNMVGIIAHLFEKYPGIINLENMHSKEHIDDHFRRNNENISRRLEWSLYKKFQKIGLVPPQLRQTIFLREGNEEQKKVNQFGIIHFVPIEKTSANCPYCGEKANSAERKKIKWEKHHFYCTNKKCAFNTEKNRKPPLEKITNSDDVAAYNIAKSKIE